MQGVQYRVIVALVFTGSAIAFYVADRAFNVPTVLMGIAALVAIAATLVPVWRHRPKQPIHPLRR